MISNSGTTSLGLYDFKRKIDAFGGVDYFRPNLAGGYLKNARVMLANGDIVRSTIDENANDPNVNMTGWLNTGNAGEVESIADLLAIQNPKNGSRVYVKSYHTGLNKGGGTFVFESSKASTNDGVVIFDGWVRQLSTPKLTTAMAGYVDGSSTAVASIRKCLAYLKTVGGGELELTDGLYILDKDSIIQDPTPNVSAYRYWFEAVSNVTITGTRKAILKVADGVVAEDALYKYAKGYQVFLDFLVTENKNFKLKGFTFDGNAPNNLLIPISDNPFGNQSQCLFVSFSKCDGFEASDLGLSKTSGHQIFRFGLGCTGHSIHHCDLSENGNINGNTNLTDHSSIYNEGVNYKFYLNTFINSSFDTVSTAIETHGKNGVVYGNIIKNYNLAFIRAAMRSDSSNVHIFGNTAEGVTTGLMYDAAAGYSLETSDFSNIFEMRPAANTGTRTLCAINTGGQFADGTLGNHKVNTYNNKFTTANPNEGIAIIAGRVPEFTSRNEFVGFSIYVQHGSSQYHVDKVVLQDKLDLAGSTIDSLINIFNWDGNISNRHLILDGNIDLMSTIAALKYAVKCDLVTLSVSGEIKGSFGANNVFPFTGAWSTNTLTFDYSCDSLVRPAYVLQGSITARIQTKSATYEKFVGSGNLVSKRYAFSAPTVAQAGGDYVGDIVYNTVPNLGGHIGWVAVASANLVVWKPFGAINA